MKVEERQIVTPCGVTGSLTMSWICIQDECDGTHHYYVRNRP